MAGDAKSWDGLYSTGRRGKYPNEMLIRFVNAKLGKADRKECRVLDLGFGTAGI